MKDFMTAVIDYTYEQGERAANRALDRTGLNAIDLIREHRAAELIAQHDGRYDKAEYHRGFATTVQEYVNDRGDQ